VDCARGDESLSRAGRSVLSAASYCPRCAARHAGSGLFRRGKYAALRNSRSLGRLTEGIGEQVRVMCVACSSLGVPAHPKPQAHIREVAGIKYHSRGGAGPPQNNRSVNMEELKQKKKDESKQVAEGLKSFGMISECPCGCGLKNDICPEWANIIRAKNEEIPF